MPLTDEEWRAFINEYNGAIGDVEADLSALLENARLELRDRETREGVSPLEADAIWETIQEGLHKVKNPLTAPPRRRGRARRGPRALHQAAEHPGCATPRVLRVDRPRREVRGLLVQVLFPWDAFPLTR